MTNTMEDGVHSQQALSQLNLTSNSGWGLHLKSDSAWMGLLVPTAHWHKPAMCCFTCR